MKKAQQNVDFYGKFDIIYYTYIPYSYICI